MSTSTSNCAAVIRTLLMHLNLCGTEIKRTRYHAAPDEFETDFWFTRTFEKPLFLFLIQNTRVTP